MRAVKRLIGFLTPYWRPLIVAGILLLVDTTLNLVPPLLQRSIIDDVIGTQDLTRLGGLILGLIAVYLVLQIGSFGEMYLRHKLGQRFILDLQVRLYAYLQRLSLSFFERTSTGELMSRVTNDVGSLEQFVTHGVTLTVVDLLRLLGACGVLLVLDWRLALAALIPLPIIAVALRRFNRVARPVYRSARDRLGEINARLQDNLAGMRVIQAFGQEESELSRFSQTSQRYYRERVRAIWAWSTFFPVVHFVAALGNVMVLGFGARMVVAGQLSLGTLVAFLSYVISF
ncbi:MAG: ABC transporter transmembrane domain-containing protein, partial [Anaerolineae bacterium]|nr:ABC transporter transmembrane domain-containing protein [Anaerolineae bacterium]